MFLPWQQLAVVVRLNNMVFNQLFVDFRVTEIYVATIDRQ